MKRWAIGSIAFLTALSLGAVAAWLPGVRPGPLASSTELGPIQLSELIPEVPDKPERLEVFDDRKVSPNDFSVKILRTGRNFHADQISAKSGEKWFGVFNENASFILRSATLKVKRVPDEIVHGPNSENKGKLTGKSVSVSGMYDPIFLVKDSPRLRPGPVTTLFVGEREDWKGGSTQPTFLDKNFHKAFELGGKTYELKVVKAQNTQGDRILALLLEGDGKRQLIHTFWTRGEGEHGEKEWLGSVGKLYWIGDLDRDNKPDLYLSLFAHETIYEAYLLLSSKADQGDLVKKAALFSTNGCG
jgi:hypothetical protein